MELRELRQHWNAFGRRDPLWAIFTRDHARDGRWDPAEFFATGTREITALMESLVEIGLPLARHRALDFGCGVGRLTQALCEHFDEAVGVDIARSMVRLARKYNRYGPRCRYDVNRVPDLRRFEDDRFDLVYSNLVLQHMRPELARQYIGEFVRVVAAGGIVVFGLPSERWLTIAPPLAASVSASGPASVVASTSESATVPATASASVTASASATASAPATTPALASIPAPLPDAAFAAQIVSDTTRRVVKPRTPIPLTVTVRNTSTSTWPAGKFSGDRLQVKLGNHWLNARGSTVRLDDARALLPRDLAPSEEAVVTLVVRSPSRPGRYQLELDLVQEEVSWFRAKGGTTVRIPVEVVGSRPWGTAARALWDGMQRTPAESRPFSLSFMGFEPRMEMYGVGPATVLDWLTGSARLLDFRVAYPAVEWPILLYYVAKAAAGSAPGLRPALPAVPILPMEAFRAEISAIDPPSAVEPDEDFDLCVTVKNVSSIVWPRSGGTLGKNEVRVGNHWLDAEGRVLIQDDGRAPLAEDVSPGQELTLRLRVRTPATTGPHILELDMTQEYVTWFNTFGSETTRIAVQVLDKGMVSFRRHGKSPLDPTAVVGEQGPPPEKAKNWLDPEEESLIPPRDTWINPDDSITHYTRWIWEYLAYLTLVAGLRRTESILELGCGHGRIARGLLAYLRSPGRYVGLDIDARRLEDARARISSRWPNFEFVLADVHSAHYNPTGAANAAAYRFPFEDAAFDVIYAASLFTHLLPAETENYFRESRRVLKPGGRCLFSCFVLDFYRGPGTSISPMYEFDHGLSGYDGVAVRDPDHPDAVISYSLARLHATAQGAGLYIDRVLPGLWAEGPGWATNEQDLLVLVHRPERPTPTRVGPEGIIGSAPGT